MHTSFPVSRLPPSPIHNLYIINLFFHSFYRFHHLRFKCDWRRNSRWILSVCMVLLLLRLLLKLSQTTTRCCSHFILAERIFISRIKFCYFCLDVSAFDIVTPFLHGQIDVPCEPKPSLNHTLAVFFLRLFAPHQVLGGKLPCVCA